MGCQTQGATRARRFTAVRAYVGGPTFSLKSRLDLMEYTSDFLAAVAASDIGPAYYALCREHPIRLDASPVKASSKDILKVASGRVAIENLQGRGTGFSLGALPDGVSLNFILQGRCTVETDFVVPFDTNPQSGTFATLCRAASIFHGGGHASPPYPRPNFYSIDELLDIFEKFDALIRRLAFQPRDNR